MFDFNFDFSESFAAMQSLVQQSYNLGAPIDRFVQTGAITSEEYKEITGDDYDETRDKDLVGSSKA